ncbi:DUF2637 domain-containing protein [Streptomyces canus]|uniref:DUF2637 domain-containing protein n=1 Tax=Streptomyces canus TaxID=58343 RepID=UPI003719B01D
MADGNGELNSSPTSTDRPKFTALQRRLVAGVGLGAALIAVIGFVGSYAAVRRLAEAKHFGAFAMIFPVGVDAGILVLLALDLLLTWLRMPLGMLRHTAWLLTAATIAFNGAAAWPDPIGVGMHAVIPILFVVVVEAARHAIGIAADISAAKHMESVRLSRWLLAPVGTFRLWRRMKLWELRSYDEVIALEQQRLIERARLRRRYGRRWRSQAPLDEVLALRLTRYGRPLAPVEGVLDAAPAPAEELAPAPAAPLPDEHDPAWDECAPFDDPMWGRGAPAIEPAPQGALELPPPPPVTPEPSAPGRPAPDDQGAPQDPAPDDEGAPERPADEGAPNDEAPRDETNPPSRTEAKRKVRALYDELNARPKEGQIVELLKSLDGYPHTSRRHAQKLRDEIERKEPTLAARGSDNVTALTGT